MTTRRQTPRFDPRLRSTGPEALAAQLDRRRFLAAAVAAAPWLLGRPASLLADEAPPGKQLIVHGLEPLNAEAALEHLVASWITPIKHFYVRSNAAAIPQLEREQFRLGVEGLVKKPASLPVAHLESLFKQQTVTATMTCAGNRRQEHNRVRPVGGVPWGAGAIGNATWTGPALADVLRYAGVQEGASHVWFEGVDEIEHQGSTIRFGGSIPLEKALANADGIPGALLALKMNGRPLTPEHGFPLRSVVPGYVGARSVKWLGKIVISDRPSPNYFLADSYKVITEDSPAQLRAAEPIQEYLINSVICVPRGGSRLAAGRVKAAGYALPPGLPGRTIARVEVSADGGRHWTPARFTTPSQPYCWRLWEAEVPVLPATTALTVRATDSAGTVQPQKVDWNLKGYLYNAWHKTPVTIN